MLIFEKLFFFIGLNLARRYALNVSWRKMVLVGSCLVFFFNVSDIQYACLLRSIDIVQPVSHLFPDDIL